MWRRCHRGLGQFSVRVGQTYPTRSVRIIVGFAVGGVTDIVARVMGRWLAERLGQQFFVENRTSRRLYAPPRNIVEHH